MATLVLGAVGTALGGPIGGAIGALAGRQVDAAIIGRPNMRGPRLKELEVTTSSYGTAIPRHYGRMRVPGTIIWATDLVEHESTSGGGKQSPSLTSYSYSVSFAVALSSRAISGIGRIWADGRLLRGAEGDLKVGGELRIHTGEADQPVDPLMLAAEGVERCPAHRGLAYVVFEDLDLGEFFNRIPALTFEVIADEAFDPTALLSGLVEDAKIDLSVPEIAGLSGEGSIADTLQLLAPIVPFATDASGDTIILRPTDGVADVIALPEAAVAVGDDSFGGAAGHVRRRASASDPVPNGLRFYDVERDFLPGIQRATVPTAQANGFALDFPVALAARDARTLIERMAGRLDWSRDRMAWRTAELSPGLVPGAVVVLPDRPGTWRVQSWEWRQSGVELELVRRAPERGDLLAEWPVDAGRSTPQADDPASPTNLVALELPWDGVGSPDTVVTLAAVVSSGTAWKGCALYVGDGSGSLRPLGPGGRTRSLVGTAIDALAPGTPALFDREATLEIDLSASDLQLVSATAYQLVQGANLALVGNELVQFANAVSLGEGRWRLAGFLRGRGGTESAIPEHVAGEAFLLIDHRPRRLDADLVGEMPGTEIVAVGLGDPEPVASPILLQGIARRPLSPVHGAARWLVDGGLALTWTRRARGAWGWQDSVEVPLHEEAERYRVEFSEAGTPVAQWLVETCELAVSPAQIAELGTVAPGGYFHVRQIGTRATSEALWLCELAP